MKKLLSVCGAIALFSFPIVTKANQNDAMIDMVVNMMKQSGQMSSMSHCLGVSEKDFFDVYKKIVEECMPIDGLEGNCMETLAPKHFGVSKSKLMACSGEDESDIDSQDETDFSELSKEEVEALVQKQQAEGLAYMNEMAASLERSSKGTEDKISLPVYNPSTLRSHYAQGMKNNKGETTLPVATLTTIDSVEKVVEYYRKSLPNFEIDNNQGSYTVIEKIPGDIFQLSLDMDNLPLYFIPHIAIYSLNTSGQETTFIVITYQPK